MTGLEWIVWWENGQRHAIVIPLPVVLLFFAVIVLVAVWQGLK